MELLQLFRPENNLQSLRSQKQIPIRLRNLTNRSVDVIWINYTGEYVKYSRLDHDNFVDINTFETHPWIAIDADTKNRLLIDKKFVFLPKPWTEFVRDRFPNLPLEAMPAINPRLPITITTPLLSLRYKTLLELRSYIKSINDVDLLGLPKELAHDLKLLIKERERFPDIICFHRR
ncbi:hypothetical protein ILUMI_26492 [Ignelater luminosus]|uniref:von Hippel-Lindau disease tumour suppressor beta domain-containing protein n=1 Tax=Ignelater luminosus TaxID=2038154 RepID=A0A8K0C6J6_IGNLU|nr:hypothetical protein ILUMI_26492 [Ignelater luminosus]